MLVTAGPGMGPHVVRTTKPACRQRDLVPIGRKGDHALLLTVHRSSCTTLCWLYRPNSELLAWFNDPLFAYCHL